jgi:hypothetical protein
MAQITLQESLDMLLQHWKGQNIITSGKSVECIEQIEKKNRIRLPQDFKHYYQRCNGMEALYPNYTDETGFLFYPLEQLVSYEIEFGVKTEFHKLMQNKQCVIFANYLQKSWWYGILTDLNGNAEHYSIVIIPNQERYKIITNSFQEFVKLYLEDSPILYDHE